MGAEGTAERLALRAAFALPSLGLLIRPRDGEPGTASVPSTPAGGAGVQPSVELIALNRMAYGPRPGDLERVQRLGLRGYVEEQLHPVEGEDRLCLAKLRRARLPIEYEAGEVEPGKPYRALKENRPLQTLGKPLSELWALTLPDPPRAYEERIRPLEEIRAATWLRAIYSKWQLREVLAEFWHNHFSVNALADERIAATWPVHDREVIRKHCLGNFRSFLEAVAQSVAMQYYLNNATSKASPANENYARELFELHTLGAPHYFNHLYNRWRDVPGTLEGRPIGYIDQDVYEAARAFTGWTIADGTDTGRGIVFPNTGDFHYYEGWHDHYQKRVLGVELEPNQPPRVDGRKVLDLVAFHPATARYVCTKLCRRLVADEPPASLIRQAVDTWVATRDKPDQIRQTVRTILLSPEFATSWGQKVKRPFELAVSFLRTTEAEVAPNGILTYTLAQMGYRHFEWPTPTGHPDTASPWLGTNVMLGRWNLLLGLVYDWFGTGSLDLRSRMPRSVRTPRGIVTFWIRRLLSRPVAPATLQALVDYASQGAAADAPVEGDEELAARIASVAALVAMTPDFQWR